MGSTEGFDAVLFASDANVVRPLGVALASLAAATSGELEVFVLQDGIGPSDQLLLRECATERLRVEFVQVPDDRLRSELLPPHLPRAALFRLLLGDLLPARIRRVLYLDVDLVVLRDPLLIEAPGTMHAVHAVRDPFRPWVGGPPPLPWSEVGADPQSPYFNSGVMLIDVPRWNDLDVAAKALALLGRHRLPFADQCALNLVLDGAWHELAPRWNVQVAHLRGDRWWAHVVTPPDELELARSGPGIVHFTGVEKPWVTGPGPDHRSTWYEILDRHTPWSGWRPEAARPSLAQRLAGRAGRFLLDRAGA